MEFELFIKSRLRPLWDRAILKSVHLISNTKFMRVIAIKRLRDFWEGGNADSEQPLKVWYQILKQNNFYTPNEIKRLFSTCSFLGDNRVVFNISGNKYRSIIHIRYEMQIIYIRFIGTHAEYDKINAKEV